MCDLGYSPISGVAYVPFITRCILAEMLSSKPLFPGRDYHHQLSIILDILGTDPPSHTDALNILIL